MHDKAGEKADAGAYTRVDEEEGAVGVASVDKLCFALACHLVVEFVYHLPHLHQQVRLDCTEILLLMSTSIDVFSDTQGIKAFTIGFPRKTMVSYEWFLPCYCHIPRQQLQCIQDGKLQ